MPIWCVKLEKYEHAEGDTPEEAKKAAIENLQESFDNITDDEITECIRVAETWEELESSTINPITQISRMSRYNHFQIDDGPEYGGWTAGARWNGWATPYFPKCEADNLSQDMSALFDNTKTFMRYNKEMDQYEFFDAAAYATPEPNNLEIWPGQDILTPYGAVCRVYPIGAGSWIWSESETP